MNEVKEIFLPTSVFGYFQKTDFCPVDGKLAPTIAPQGMLGYSRRFLLRGFQKFPYSILAPKLVAKVAKPL